MSLLSTIAQEHTRLTRLGYVPLVILVGTHTKDALESECDKVFGEYTGKVIGMEVREEHLADGVVRFLADEKSVKEFVR